MKKILFLTIATLFIALGNARAQSAAFVGITPDARTAAMGNAGVALPANAFAIYQNSAAIALSENKAAIGYNFTPWISSFQKGYSLHSAAGYYKLSDKNALTLGFRYFQLPESIGLDDLGNPLEAFRPNEMSIDLGYSMAIGENIGIAANVRYVSSSMSNVEGAKTGSAFAADLGFYYRKNNLSAGLSVNNLGTKIDYGYGGYSMPARVKAAGAYVLPVADKHEVTGALQVAYMFAPSDFAGIEGGIGVEYMYNKMIAVRAGYNLGDKEKTGYSYATLGCGVNYSLFSLDFAYLLAGGDSPMKNVWYLSLGVKF